MSWITIVYGQDLRCSLPFVQRSCLVLSVEQLWIFGLRSASFPNEMTLFRSYGVVDLLTRQRNPLRVKWHMYYVHIRVHI